MMKNVNGIDRWLRIIVGVAVLLLVFVGPHTKWGFLGLILIATGLVGYCPVYHLFGRTGTGGGRDAAT